MCLGLELLPSNVLGLARNGTKMLCSLIRKEEKGIVLRIFGLRVFECFLLSLFVFNNSLPPKASPLDVWWNNLFIYEFVVVLGGKTNGI